MKRPRFAPILQPRMGFPSILEMSAGMRAVARLPFDTRLTITVDSYTRLRQWKAAETALRSGRPLNGFPICSHPRDEVLAMVNEAEAMHRRVQVRHGSPLVEELFRCLSETGIALSEGGPISYALPYGRVPVRETVPNWARAIEQASAHNPDFGLETFGGCMMGQLMPPSLLLSLAVLEGMFFEAHGVRHISLSVTQQSNALQDIASCLALRDLALEFLPGAQVDTVLYMLMGRFPTTAQGFAGCLRSALTIAVMGGMDRVIVKTIAEARKIPSVSDNLAALRSAHTTLRVLRDRWVGQQLDWESPIPEVQAEAEALADEARCLISAVLNCGPTIDSALINGLRSGLIDVPFCLHPDNAAAALSGLDDTGRVQWLKTGKVPVPVRTRKTSSDVSSRELAEMLDFARSQFDNGLTKG